ncbi:MAG: BON domain-containing protein [Acidobacteria bacterium]|nr:BON domain-containing protein [Acidobacteriota bacterium]
MNAKLYHSLRNGALATSLIIMLVFAGCKGKTADDATLTTDIQQKLASDSALQNESIQVSVNGGVATLNGRVSNDAARSLASNDAAGVKDVKQVINNLVVGPPPSTTAVAPAPAPVPVETPAPTVRAKKEVVREKPSPVPAPAPVVRQPVPAPAPVAAAPAPPPAPRFRDVTVQAGTTLPVRITQTLDSGTSQTGDSFSGVLASDIVVDGFVALHRGTAVTGRVIEAKDATHFKGSSALSVELVGINARGNRQSIATDAVSKEGKARGTNTAKKAGIGAVGGAILGGILGGGKGAAIGAAAGGAGGAGINAVTKGEQVQFPSESILRFRLARPITMHVSNDNQ